MYFFYCKENFEKSNCEKSFSQNTFIKTSMNKFEKYNMLRLAELSREPKSC